MYIIYSNHNLKEALSRWLLKSRHVNMLPTITQLENTNTWFKTKVWETSKATLLFGMSWCWVFSSYPVQIYFPSFILILVLGAWSVGTTSTCSIYSPRFIVFSCRDPAGSWPLLSRSCPLSFFHSFVLPHLSSSFCLSLSLYPLTHTLFQVPSDSSHPFLIQATVVSPPYSLPQFTALSLLISISTYKIFITLSSNYLISKCCIWFWLTLQYSPFFSIC